MHKVAWPTTPPPNFLQSQPTGHRSAAQAQGRMQAHRRRIHGSTCFRFPSPSLGARGRRNRMEGEDVPFRPPRLEDAGLEDCALPPESIAEAFSLAAAAVSSRLSRLPLSEDSDNEEDEVGRVSSPREGGCVDDAGPARGVVPDADALVGGGVTGDRGADEVVVVGGGSGGEDAVVVGGRAEEEDRVLVAGEGRGEKKLGKEDGCVEGVREGVNEPRREEGDGEDDEAAEKVTLVLDFD